MTSSRGTFSDKRQDLNRLLMLFYGQRWKSLCPPLKLTINFSTTETNVAAVTPLLQQRGRFIWGGHANDRKFHLREEKNVRLLLLLMLLLYYDTHFNFGISLRVAILLLRLCMKNAFFATFAGMLSILRILRIQEVIIEKKKWIISHLLWQM